MSVGRVGVVAHLLALSILSSCEGAFDPSAVRSVSVGEGGTSLNFEVGNCTAETRIDDVVEGIDAVIVRLSEKTKNNDDCGGRLVTVELDEPLGDRIVVNGHTGMVLEQNGPGTPG